MSKILATLSDIFSNVDVDDDYQGSVFNEKKAAKGRGRKKPSKSITASVNSDLFSTINEEEYQAKHVAELKKKDKVKKKKPNKLMATLTDIFGTHNIEHVKTQRPSEQRPEKRRTNSSRRESKSKRIDLSLYEEPAAQLHKEREKTKRAEEQIRTLVAMNRDLQEQAILMAEEGHQDVNRNVLNLKLRLNREENSRLEAERREYLALKELESMRVTLATSQQRQQQVEAELTEAASDILDTRQLHNTCQDLQKSCQGAMRHERDAWNLAERRKKEIEALEGKLKHSEQEKLELLEELARLKAESQHWERALDTLQEQVDKVLVHGSLHVAPQKKGGMQNGIAEVDRIGENEIYLSSSNSTAADNSEWRDQHFSYEQIQEAGHAL